MPFYYICIPYNPAVINQTSSIRSALSMNSVMLSSWTRKPLKVSSKTWTGEFRVHKKRRF